MATEIKKKVLDEEKGEHLKSKGANGALWFVAVAMILVAAVGNTYFASHFSFLVRILLLVVLVVGGFAVAAFTNEGQKAIGFIKESRTELRKIIWPTRPEATQTTLMVAAICAVVALALWGIDSLIVAVIDFLMTLRF